MPEPIVSIEGVAELKESLSKYRVEFIRDVEKIVSEHTSLTKRRAKENAPVGSSRTVKGRAREGGTLRNRIRSKDVSRLLGVQHRTAKTVAARAPHRHLVELGTTSRRTKKGANRGSMPANNFMERAVRTVEPQFKAAMRERVNREEVI